MKPFLFSLLLVIPIVSLAQSNYHKGYVVTNSNDTLKGYVDYKERALNPSSLSFKTTPDSEVQTYNVQNCSAYGVDNLVAYQRFLVDITMSKINVSDLSRGVDLKSKKETVFLNVVQAGKNVTLFSYRDALKTRYYLLEKDSTTPYELVRQVYLKKYESSISVTDKQYQEQLKLALNKFNKDAALNPNKFTNLDYDAVSLTKAVALINGEQQLQQNKQPKERIAKSTQVPNTRFFIGTGLNASKISYSGGSDFANAAAKSKTSYLPFLTVGVDLFANPAIGKLIYRLELSLLSSKNEISSTTDVAASSVSKHTFNQNDVMLTPQIIYNFYNTDKTKVFLGAGVGLNVPIYSNSKQTTVNAVSKETEIIENPVNFGGFYFSAPVTAGVVFNKKIELSAGYSFPVPLNYSEYYTVKMQRYKLGISYLFGKH